MDFKDSLRSIKKELVKELDYDEEKELLKKELKEKDDLIAKETRLFEEYLDFIKDSDIKKP